MIMPLHSVLALNNSTGEQRTFFMGFPSLVQFSLEPDWTILNVVYLSHNTEYVKNYR